LFKLSCVVNVRLLVHFKALVLVAALLSPISLHYASEAHSTDVGTQH